MKKSGSTCLKVGLELVERWKTKKRNPKIKSYVLTNFRLLFVDFSGTISCVTIY